MQSSPYRMFAWVQGEVTPPASTAELCPVSITGGVRQVAQECVSSPLLVCIHQRAAVPSTYAVSMRSAQRDELSRQVPTAPNGRLLCTVNQLHAPRRCCCEPLCCKGLWQRLLQEHHSA